jgi:hypothetical protein
MQSPQKQLRSSIAIAGFVLLTAIFIILAGAIVPAHAQTYNINFPEPTSYLNADPGCNEYCPSTTAVAVGDFNGDGKLDVLNLGSDSSLNVVLGNGNGTFQTPIRTNIAASCYGPDAVIAGDFKGSGVLDVAVWGTTCNNGGSMQLNIYLGTGNGTFTTGAQYNPANSNNYAASATSLVTADVNGDGHLDLIALTQYNGVYIYLGNGDGTFQTPTNYPTGGTPAYGIAVGDLNSDSNPDLAITVTDGISVLLNTGIGTFGTATYYPSGIGYSNIQTGIAIGDLDGDKYADIVATQSSGVVVVYLNQGNGTFAVGKTVSGGFYTGTNVLLADLNDDKHLDIIVPDSFGNVFTFYGKGNGTFTTGPAYSLEAANDSSPYLVAVGDFNGDGTLDLLNTTGVVFASGGDANTVSLGRGDGTFQTAQMYAYTQNNALNIVTADFNNDGFPDIAQSVDGVINGKSLNGLIGINLGSSHGAPGATTYATASKCTGNQVYWIATGEVYGDGNADLVATMRDDSSSGCQNHTVAVLKGLGTGKFSKAVYYSTGATAQENQIYLVPLTSSGSLDIVTANNDSSISVLLNNGKGTYTTEPLITSLSAIEGYGVYLTFGDFNGDGNMDIAATLVNASSGVVYVLPGNGNGTFGAPIETATPITATALAAGDFSNNGKTDLLIAGQGGGCEVYHANYVYLQGKGNGTFEPGTVNCGPYASSPSAAIVTDFNADGKLDAVIATNGAAGGPLLLQGNGNGTFNLSTETFYTGENYSSVAVADFNNDGMPDIALLNQGSFVPSFVSIMLNATQPVSVSPLTVNFGSETVGEKKLETIILTNDQSTSLAITRFTIGGTNAGDFTETNNCGKNVQGGEDCTITVKFDPAASGTRSGTLTITDGAGTQTVKLNGTGK